MDLLAPAGVGNLETELGREGKQAGRGRLWRASPVTEGKGARVCRPPTLEEGGLGMVHQVLLVCKCVFTHEDLSVPRNRCVWGGASVYWLAASHSPLDPFLSSYL